MCHSSQPPDATRASDPAERFRVVRQTYNLSDEVSFDRATLCNHALLVPSHSVLSRDQPLALSRRRFLALIAATAGAAACGQNRTSVIPTTQPNRLGASPG